MGKSWQIGKHNGKNWKPWKIGWKPREVDKNNEKKMKNHGKSVESHREIDGHCGKNDEQMDKLINEIEGFQLQSATVLA